MWNMRRVLTATLAAALGAALSCDSRPTASVPHHGGGVRIISLAPSATEILFKLGMGDALVGVSDCCDFPPPALRIERMGNFGAPNVEEMLQQRPNLVVAAGLEGGQTPRWLRERGVAVLDIPIHSFAELFAAVRQIGQAVERTPQAEALVAEMEAQLAALPKRASLAAPPRVFVEVGDNPLTSAGSESFLDDVIARAGGVNVAHEIRRAYFHISPEQVIAWDPDVILVASMQAGGGTAERLAGRLGWSEIKAVRNRRIIDDIPADLLFRPGPRLIQGAQALAARLRSAAPPRTANASGGE